MSDKRFVYLAGPICGCDKGEANDWRQYVDAKLKPHNIVGISPLRCEPLIGSRYTLDYPDPRFGTPRAIAAKNRFDVRQSHMTLAYLPVLPPSEDEVQRLVREAWPAVLPGSSSHAGAFEAGVRAALKRVQSYGTMQELAWANEAGKQTLMVSDDPYVMRHPVIDSTASWKLETLDEAIDVIVGVLGGYVGGKNV